VGLVVQRPCKDARRGRLADPAHARQHPGLRYAARREGICKGADQRLLTDESAEVGGPVLARKNAIAASLALLLIAGVAHASLRCSLAGTSRRFLHRDLRPRGIAASMTQPSARR